MKHTLDIRVYYEDTDAGGIIYHAQYLNYAERARTEFLRTTGFQNSDVHNNLGVMFVVRNIEIDYLKTAGLDDLLQIQTTITALKNSSFIMHQRTCRGDDIIADMKVVLVCVDTKTYQPTRLPEDIKASFQAYQETLE